MKENRNSPVKVLFVVGDMGVGGVQSGIMNFVQVCPKDEVHFDLLIHSKEKGFHEDSFLKYGTIYHLPIKKGKSKIGSAFFMVFNNFIFKYKLISFLKKHDAYDAVHCKSIYYCATVAESAKMAGVPVRVVQCHMDKPNHLNPLYRLFFRWCADRIEKNATHKLAVSPSAAELMFGRHGGRVIKNPTISLSRLNPMNYHPRPHDGINFIQIGTYSHRKNQIFSINILAELIKKGTNAKLTFIGFSLDDPGYLEEVEQTVFDKKLSSYVVFLPKDADVPKMLSESDYMLIPSLREGLPNVALEAQAMGVPCFISDTVNPETDCGLCTFLSLEDGPEKWAEVILKYRETHGTEKTYIDMSAWDNVNVCQEYVKIWRGEG